MHLGYIKPVRHISVFSSCVRPKNKRVVHSDICDAVFPVDSDGMRIVDAQKMILSPNIDPSIKEVIRNNVSLSLGDDNALICDDLDTAELVAFDPALQVGEEVDLCADGLNKFINETLNNSSKDDK